MDEFLTLITLKYGRPTTSREYMESLPTEVLIRTHEIIFPTFIGNLNNNLIYRLERYALFSETDRAINALTTALIEYHTLYG